MILQVRKTAAVIPLKQVQVHTVEQYYIEHILMSRILNFECWMPCFDFLQLRTSNFWRCLFWWRGAVLQKFSFKIRQKFVLNSKSNDCWIWWGYVLNLSCFEAFNQNKTKFLIQPLLSIVLMNCKTIDYHGQKYSQKARGYLQHFKIHALRW